MDKPLRRTMSSPEAAGQMALLAVELNEFDIQYRPRIAIKGQVVADFIAEFTFMEGQGAEVVPQWSVPMDGSLNKQVERASMVLYTPERDKIKCMICLDFPTTNNEVEYEALVARLDLARVAGAKNMVVYCDSQVITN